MAALNIKPGDLIQFHFNGYAADVTVTGYDTATTKYLETTVGALRGHIAEVNDDGFAYVLALGIKVSGLFDTYFVTKIS